MFRYLFPAALLSALVALPALVAAQETRPLRDVQASRVMYEAGVAARDPLLVLAAAKLRRASGLNRTPRAPEGSEQTGQPAAGLDWPAMLDTARDLAAGDDLMLGLVADVAAEADKGVTNGPVYNIASLGAKRADTYRNVPFDGQKYAEVYVEAKGSQDLNVHIYDAQNRLVCSDTDSSAIAYCGWRPRQAGSFTVKVTNASGSGAQYSLMTN